MLIIGPWNLPFALTLQPLISALAAGNTAGKPSEHAPAVSALITKACAHHFDSDVVTVVEGDGRVAADLVAMPFDHIFFTGGGTIGRKVLAGASANLTPVTLELEKALRSFFQELIWRSAPGVLIWGKVSTPGKPASHRIT